MNKFFQKIEQWDICRKSVKAHMRQYLEFVKAFLSDENTIKEAEAMLPFDGELPGSIHFFKSRNHIKGMGITVMRMELEPALYSLGTILEIGRPQNGKGRTTVTYLSACKTLDEYREWVMTPEFADAAYNHFLKTIDLFFWQKAIK